MSGTMLALFFQLAGKEQALSMKAKKGSPMLSSLK